jgi:hypothetical protein
MSASHTVPNIPSRNANTLRVGAALLIAVGFAAIIVHGKTSRGPKPVIVETVEMSRFADRPQMH